MFDAPAGGTQQAGIEAIGLADDRREVAQVGDIDLAIGKRFVDHRPRALEVIPLDLDAIGGEGLFQQLLVAQYIRHSATAVLATGTQIRHGNTDFLQLARMQ
ncbi:hypothetical protein D9M71_155490 [compost metagenome]